MNQLFLVVLVLFAAVGSSAAEKLRIMSFNVRYPSKDDGPNVWEQRRDILAAAIRAKDPDLIGAQELFRRQGDYIVEKLPQYEWFGRSRRGNEQDEHMGVFYKKDKLRLISSGDFWLSETPDVPGSMSWNVSLPRMVTWGLFELTGSGARFYLYNTHFAHRSQDEEARRRSAEVILTRARELPSDLPIVLTGDFNAPAGQEVYKILSQHFEDAWQVAAQKIGPEATFHGFRGTVTGSRIDWILYKAPWKVTEAETFLYNEDGRYPSDHYPVFVVFEL